MSLPTIAQAELLAAEFDSLLKEYNPSSVAVIGCAGGNGFDRISQKTTSRVVGIDINSTYIAEASTRYASLIPNLELYVADIQQPGLSFEPVDFIDGCSSLTEVETARKRRQGCHDRRKA